MTAPAIGLGKRSVVAIALTSAVGLLAFGWPLLTEPHAGLTQNLGGPWFFALLLPMVLAVMLSQVVDGGIDAKAIALLGVLTAVAAALRPLSGGVTGFQPMFVVIVLAGRVFGPGFGFILGATSMTASALLTGGVGPWLPFQILGASWLGLGAGLLPRCSGKREVVLLASYGAAGGLLYGLLLNLWFWPFLATTGEIAFEAGAPITDNLGRLIAFTFATSLGFDVPRALGNGLLLLLLGRPALNSLRRSHRRAAFGRPPQFAASSPPSEAALTQ